MQILVVDDQRGARRVLSNILATLPDMNVLEAASLSEALDQLGKSPIDAALIDIRLDSTPGNRDGLTLVRDIRERFPSVVPIVVTISNEMAEIREAMRVGAYDYILKDELCPELVVPVVEELRDHRRLEREVQSLRARHAPTTIRNIVGASAAIQQLRDAIHKVALSDRPVLVRGPTGAGKELVVQSLHALGAHPEAPLLDLNCGAMPAQLVESLLFGHERGAFTGADRRQEGQLLAVGEGTLFLDEIGELPFELQAKLLRVLETGTFRAVGSAQTGRFRGRVIAATHADLESAVREGRFRRDLYYRLNVLEVHVPSVDERRSDIPLLVSHFVQAQHRAIELTAESFELLKQARWPGNVRQIKNLVDRLVVFAPTSRITPEVVAPFLEREDDGQRDVMSLLVQLSRAALDLDVPDKLGLMERTLIREAMEMTHGNKTAAAKLLGVHRKVIERRMDALNEPSGVGLASSQ